MYTKFKFKLFLVYSFLLQAVQTLRKIRIIQSAASR